MKPELVIPTARRLIKKNAHMLRKSSWNKLSIPDKRKAILLDAMKSLLLGIYIPESQYEDTSILHQIPARQRNDSLKDVLEDFEKCEVCQRGMLLLSCIRFNNKVTISNYHFGYITSKEEDSGIDKFIPHSERAEMESDFEGISKFTRKYRTTGEDDAVRRVRLSVAIFLNAYLYGKYEPSRWLTRKKQSA